MLNFFDIVIEFHMLMTHKEYRGPQILRCYSFSHEQILKAIFFFFFFWIINFNLKVMEFMLMEHFTFLLIFLNAFKDMSFFHLF